MNKNAHKKLLKREKNLFVTPKTICMQKSFCFLNAHVHFTLAALIKNHHKSTKQNVKAENAHM